MKKFLLIMFLGAVVLPVSAYAPPSAITTVHDMQMIKEQKFRMEELNDYNTVKQEKERYQKRNRVQTPVVQEPTIIKAPEMIRENGTIKIKYEN